MTLSSQEILDLRRLIVQLCEGQIADEEGSQLKSWLADSEESRWIFAEYNALVALLELEIPTLACDECGMMNDDCTEDGRGGQHSLDIQTVDSRPSPAPRLPPHHPPRHGRLFLLGLAGGVPAGNGDFRARAVDRLPSRMCPSRQQVARQSSVPSRVGHA